MRLAEKPAVAEDTEACQQAVSIVGGRLSYLSRVCKANDMVQEARRMLTVEKAWLLSQIGLIPNCDDDVMDEQKWSSCSWLLLREFVRMRREDERKRDEAVAAGELDPEGLEELPVPKLSYVRSSTFSFPRHSITDTPCSTDVDRS